MKSKSKIRKVFIIIFIIVVLIIAVITAYFISIFKEINYKELDVADLGISSNTVSEATKKDKITNIALFGIDQRNGETKVHSDAIIVLSIDKERKKIKLSSIMRDSLVTIDKFGQNKITQAYFNGGPQLAVKTLNQNFSLDIEEYASVNFRQMAQIIDAVGGVEIDVTASEQKDANNSIHEQSIVADLSRDFIEKPGLQVLNGTQAVAYARIRYVGNGDFERTSRQREVLSKLFDKALNMSPVEYPEFARKFFPMVETSLSFDEIISLSSILLGNVKLEEARFPNNNDLIGNGSIFINKAQCINYDLEATKKRLKEFIYDDIKPE